MQHTLTQWWDFVHTCKLLQVQAQHWCYQSVNRLILLVLINRVTLTLVTLTVICFLFLYNYIPRILGILCRYILVRYIHTHTHTQMSLSWAGWFSCLFPFAGGGLSWGTSPSITSSNWSGWTRLSSLSPITTSSTRMCWKSESWQSWVGAACATCTAHSACLTCVCVCLCVVLVSMFALLCCSLLQWHCDRSSVLPRGHVRKPATPLHHDPGLFGSLQTSWHR